MPYRVTYALDLFRGDKDRDLARASLNVMLKALFDLDVLYLRFHPEAPLLYSSGVKYMEEPPGQEEWQDIPTTLKMRMGDCLPLSTLVLRENMTLARIADLASGDIIRGANSWTTVRAAALTGKKPILAFKLENGRTLRCSPEHKLFKDGAMGDQTTRASEVRVGDTLRTPHVLPAVQVEAIREEPEEACGDIETSTHEFYLPESGVIVHNCEDLATWRAAELAVRYKIPARPFFQEQKRADGSYLYHILVRYPDGRVEDPSRILGMR